MYEASILLALLHELVGSVSLSNDTTRSNVLLNTVCSLAVHEKQFMQCSTLIAALLNGIAI